MEILNTDGASHNMSRMNISLFYSLHDLLEGTCGLKSSTRMSFMESLAIFLITYRHGWSNNALTSISKHSGKTISKKKSMKSCIVWWPCARTIFDLLIQISSKCIVEFLVIEEQYLILNIALELLMDPTLLTPSSEEAIRYSGSGGNETQNVPNVVDFDMKFTYASIGHMHDTGVLFHALRNDMNNFPHPLTCMLEYYGTY
jgi:hypothetical protein